MDSDWRIYGVDVGVIRHPPSRNGLAWCGHYRRENSYLQGRSLDQLAQHVAEDVAGGHPVAIGFECPLFLPVPPPSIKTCTSSAGYAPIHAREIERAVIVDGVEKVAMRAWYTNAGAAAATKGLLVLRHFLKSLLDLGVRAEAISTRGDAIESDRVWIWEAFVSSVIDGQRIDEEISHVRDARLAVDAFRWYLDLQEAGTPWFATGAMRVVSGHEMLLLDDDKNWSLQAEHVWNIPRTVLSEVIGEMVASEGRFDRFTIVRPLDAGVIVEALADAASAD